MHLFFCLKCSSWNPKQVEIKIRIIIQFNSSSYPIIPQSPGLQSAPFCVKRPFVKREIPWTESVLQCVISKILRKDIHGELWKKFSSLHAIRISHASFNFSKFTYLFYRFKYLCVMHIKHTYFGCTNQIIKYFVWHRCIVLHWSFLIFFHFHSIQQFDRDESNWNIYLFWFCTIWSCFEVHQCFSICVSRSFYSAFYGL